jgi:hypothetical protein
VWVAPRRRGPRAENPEGAEHRRQRRWITLSPNEWDQLLSYLERYCPGGGAKAGVSRTITSSSQSGIGP